MTNILDGITCVDCVEGMKQIPDNFIDLTVTSPPYDDLRDYNSSVDFFEVAKNLFRITKDGGVVVWNVNDRIKNGTKSLSSFRQALLFYDAGFLVNDVMIWKKSNPMPQVRQPRYNQCFEYMFIFSKGKPKTFNPYMIDCKCAGQSYDSTCKQITKGKSRVKKSFNINSQKVDNNIWEFAISQNKTQHPAVFPIELPLRHINTWSNEGDIVFDLFAGSGTTLLAAKQLGRHFIGFDIDENYCKIAQERISNYERNRNQ